MRHFEEKRDILNILNEMGSLITTVYHQIYLRGFFQDIQGTTWGKIGNLLG